MVWTRGNNGRPIQVKSFVEKKEINWSQFLDKEKNKFPNCVGKKIFPDCPSSLEEGFNNNEFEVCRKCPQGGIRCHKMIEKMKKEKENKGESDKNGGNG